MLLKLRRQTADRRAVVFDYLTTNFSITENGMKLSLYVMDMFKNEIDRRRRPPTSGRFNCDQISTGAPAPAAWQHGTTVGRRSAVAALLLSWVA